MLRVGSGQVASRVFLISWVGSDRVNKNANVTDRVGGPAHLARGSNVSKSLPLSAQ